MEADFWHNRWENELTGFHLNEVNPHLKANWSLLKLEKNSRIFVPLCGKTLDLIWLAEQGFQVVGVELSVLAAEAFFAENNLAAQQSQVDDFTLWQSENISIFCGDFFNLSTNILGEIDAVYDKLRKTENITFLVNNAGYGIPGSFIESDLAKQIDMINVHNIASFQLCKAVLPQMVERNTGTIINVSSISGLIVKYGNVTYTTTKAFLITLSEALQEELKHTNIKIQALCPGMTESGFHDTKELEKFDRTSVPKKFWMSSNEVAQKSLEALSKKKTVYVPGFRNRLIVTLSNSKIFGKIIVSLAKRKLSKKK